MSFLTFWSGYFYIHTKNTNIYNFVPPYRVRPSSNDKHEKGKTPRRSPTLSLFERSRPKQWNNNKNTTDAAVLFTKKTIAGRGSERESLRGREWPSATRTRHKWHAKQLQPSRTFVNIFMLYHPPENCPGKYELFRTIYGRIHFPPKFLETLIFIYLYYIIIVNLMKNKK